MRVLRNDGKDLDMSRFAVTYCDVIGCVDVIELADESLAEAQADAKEIAETHRWPWHTVNEVITEPTCFKSIG